MSPPIRSARTDYADLPCFVTIAAGIGSSCIRRSLVTKNQCPSCRAAASLGEIVKNPSLEAVAVFFTSQRDALMTLSVQPVFRVGPAVGGSTGTATGGTGPLKSAGRSRALPSASQEAAITEPDAAHPFGAGAPAPQCTPPAVAVHGAGAGGVSSWLGGGGGASGAASGLPSQRLPLLVYTMMKDEQLRRELAKHGLPTTGCRKAMVDRHQDYVHRVNAELDSAHPR
jgi:E3 ubiquitin-protein ligase RAD18